jgi:hypothetical protein
VELEELQVDQLGPGLKSHGQAVAGRLPRVAGELEDLAPAPGGHHHRLGPEDDEAAVFATVSKGARDASVRVLEQPRHGVFHEDVDAGVDALVLEAADQLQTGPVADVGKPPVAVGPEWPLVDLAICGSVEYGAPALQLQHPVGRLLGEDLGHPPVVDPLAPFYGVGEVGLPAVFGVDVAQCGGHPPLGHHGVGLTQ